MKDQRLLPHLPFKMVILTAIVLLGVGAIYLVYTAHPSPNPFPVENGSQLDEQEINPAQSFAFISNPAAVYCSDLGYQFSIASGEEGQRGLCSLPDQTSCDAWEFLEGKCGQEYSYCAQQGYGIKVKTDGHNPFTHDYAVCIAADGSEMDSVVRLSGLDEKIYQTGCSDASQQASSTASAGASNGKASLPPELLSLPTSFDWRNYQGQNWLTSIKNQAACGSCWAFASVGAVEAAYNIGYNNPNLDLDLSEEYLVSGCSGAGTCCGGSAYSALSFIMSQGIPDEACLPYADSNCSCNGSCSTSCTYNSGGSCSNRTCANRCSDWASRLSRVDGFGPISSNASAIKQSIVDNGPAVVLIGIGDAYGGYFNGDIYRCTNDSGINHAVVAVGYDDAGGYWIIRNSWGTGWNGDGYFKLGYGECMVEAYPYYVLENRATPTPTPTITRTPSRTPSATLTPSQTPSKTPSRTPLLSATVTLTPSQTPTLLNTATLTFTSTITPTLSTAQVHVVEAFTTDENWNRKTTFAPGDFIYWVVQVENLTGASADVLLTWNVSGPNDEPFAYWSGTLTTSTGSVYWGLPGTIPVDEGGTYSLNGSSLFEGISSQASALYYVTGPTVTPIPGPMKKVFIPIILR